jgi:hypothetical protein
VVLGLRNRQGIDDRWLLALSSAVLMIYAGYGLARHTSRQDSKMAASPCL